MLYTTYKKGIEVFDRNTPKTDDKLLSGGNSEDYEFGHKFKKDDEIFTVTDWFNIKKFLKFQAIKSNEEEIELLKSNKKDINGTLKNGTNQEIEFLFRHADIGMIAEHYRKVGYNKSIQDQISHLINQNNLIEEDKI